MKSIMLLSVLFFSTSLFSQQPSSQAVNTDYLQKSKKQKTMAWILLGGGTTLGFIGLTQFNFAGSDDGDVNNGPATIMSLAGTAAVITSIPFFSAAKKNRKKATSVSLKMEKVPVLQTKSLTSTHYPAISFRLPI